MDDLKNLVDVTTIACGEFLLEGCVRNGQHKRFVFQAPYEISPTVARVLAERNDMLAWRCFDRSTVEVTINGRIIACDPEVRRLDDEVKRKPWPF